jgi:hypothetical protein
MRPLLVRAHQARVAYHIRGENGGQLAFDAFRGQSGAPQTRGPKRSSALGRILPLRARSAIPFRWGTRSPEAVTPFAVRRGKPSVRFVTRACEGHPKQYQIRYRNVEPLFYSVCSPARVTNRTFRQLPLKRTVVGSLRQGREDTRRGRSRSRLKVVSLRFRDQQSPFSSDRDRKGNDIDL